MNLIEVRNLNFRYPDRTHVLKEIGLSVKEGEFVAIMGANGSGKTTLLKAIVGLLHPTTGAVVIAGRKVAESNLEQVHKEVGFVFQDPNDQLFAPTVAEDIAFGPLNMGLSKGAVEKRVLEAMELTGVKDLASKTVHSLSFGQMKKVSVAGVLAMQPKVLLLDEPTASLDPMGASKLMKLFKELNQKLKITIVMATHDVDLIPLYADRMFILRKGKMVAGGTLQEVFSDTQVIRESKLRLPRIAHMVEILQKEYKVFPKELPLTIGQARKEIMRIIESQICEGENPKFLERGSF